MSFYPHYARGAIISHPEEAVSPRAKRLAAEMLARIAARVPTDWSDPTPRKRCPRCRGAGVHEDDAGSCTECRGFRSVEMTEPELRTAYREARRLACERLLTTPAAFDAAIAKGLPAGASAAEWAAAAIAVARKTRAPKKK